MSNMPKSYLGPGCGSAGSGLRLGPPKLHGSEPLYGLQRIRIHPKIKLRIRIPMFLGLLDRDPLFRGMTPDPDPSIIKQK
jgi:hypothetical protein